MWTKGIQIQPVTVKSWSNQFIFLILFIHIWNMIMHIHESFNWVSQSHQKLSYDYLNFKTPAPLFNQKPGKHVIPNNVRHTRTSCSYAQRTLNFTPSMAALIMENVWHQTLWRIIPFQLSVDNVKIIIRRDSSVDRQHLFIMERREGGGANNLQMCSAHAIKGLTWNSFHLSYFPPLFVAHLKQDPFMLTCIISPVAWLRLSPLSVFGGMHSKYVVQFLVSSPRRRHTSCKVCIWSICTMQILLLAKEGYEISVKGR